MTKWDDRYRRGDNLNAEPHPLVTRCSGMREPGRALDLACGAGRNSIHLASQGWRVTAVDSSKVAGEILKVRAEEAGVSVDFVLADLESGQFEIGRNEWDLIVVCFYLQRNLFPLIKKGLKKGGIAIAVIPLVDDDPQAKPMNPDYLLQPGELRTAFEGLDVIHYFEGRRSESGHQRAVAEIVAGMG